MRNSSVGPRQKQTSFPGRLDASTNNSYTFYWIDKNIYLGFSVTPYGKIGMNALANPIPCRTKQQ